ncbi:MAG: RNA polymerase sigma factor [Planctomycetota bacterium]
MLEFKTGDEGAFRAIVERFQKPLINFFYRLLWDRTLAEDYAQEVFIRIYVHRDAYEPRAKFSSYLFRIARNYWIDQHRSNSKRPSTISLSSPLRREGERELLLEDVVAAPREAAEPSGVPAETRERVEEALRALPEEQRMVFLLGEREGMKYSEVAQTLGIPVGTVKSRMHHAVRRLREILARERAGGGR